MRVKRNIPDDAVASASGCRLRAACAALLAVALTAGTATPALSQELPAPSGTRPPELVVQSAHPSSVITMALNPQGSLLATGSDDGTIKLWTLPGERLLRSFRGHTAPVHSVSFLADGKSIFSESPHISTLH